MFLKEEENKRKKQDGNSSMESIWWHQSLCGEKQEVSVLIDVSFVLPMTFPGVLNWGVDHPYALKASEKPMGVHISQKKLAGRRCELKYELKCIRQEA